MTEDSQSKPKQFFQSFLLAGAISTFSKTLVAPLETAILHTSIYNQNTISYLKQTIKERGISTLWRHNLANLRVYAPHQALNFAFYDLFKNTLSSHSHPKMEFWRFLMSHMAAGAAAGGLTLLIVYPRGLSKLNRIQLAADYGKNTSSTKERFLRLYKGFSISLFGVMVYRGVYFGGYETAKKMTFPQWEERGFVEKYLVALGTTSFAVLLSNPVDAVRRKMILKSENLPDSVKKIYHEEGWKAFVKGSRSSWSSIIAASLNLVLYDELQCCLFERNRAKI